MAIRGLLFDLDSTRRESAATAADRSVGWTAVACPALVGELDAHYGSGMGAS
jgi:hypothetical protein